MMLKKETIEGRSGEKKDEDGEEYVFPHVPLI